VLNGLPEHSRTSPRRLAAIDVGTNSLRLIVVEASPDGSYRLIDDEKAITRLGRGFYESGTLQPQTMLESAVTIARMRGIAEGYGVDRLRVVGTSAVREASNQAEFLALVKEKAGLDLEVISAEDEAKLAYMSVDHAFDIGRIGVAVVDIGGGSTEIVLSSSGVVEAVATLRLGAVRLTERYGPGDDSLSSRDAGKKAHRQGFGAMRRHVREMLEEELGRPPFVPQMMFGTGGTFTTLAAISMHRGQGRSESDLLPFTVRGYEMQRSEVRHLLDWLRGMPVRARARVPGMSPDRAEIIVAGLTIAESVMKQLGVNALRIHDRGIRDGIILEMIRELYPPASRPAHDPRDRLRCARQFGLACRYEEPHSNHVAMLATQLFDQVAMQTRGSREWASAVNRELLEAAAILHDIGYFINYSRHHKHSYHMIIHSDLPGFTHREREIVANVARYHRRAEPKSRHPSFGGMTPADQDLVRRLSSILRIADGLDRRHVQAVQGIDVVVARDAARVIVTAEEDPAVDVWGAERKKDLFEKVFGLATEIHWAGRTAAEPPAPEQAAAPMITPAETPPPVEPRPGRSRERRVVHHPPTEPRPAT